MRISIHTLVLLSLYDVAAKDLLATLLEDKNFRAVVYALPCGAFAHWYE